MLIHPRTKIERLQIKAIISKGGMILIDKAFETRQKKDIAFLDHTNG